VRSFVGLVLGRLGPRAHNVAAGTFMTLLVGEQTRSLFWITFALTAHRFVTWIAHPIAGRWSDRSGTRIGKRAPFMVTGLLIAGVCTALYTHAGGYWPLVGLMVLARLAFVGYSLPAAALTPEMFGGSRWLRALIAVSVGGLLVGLSIRLTVVATWDQHDPTTWRPAYYLAAAYIVFAALSIAFLVRELPSVARTAEHTVSTRWMDTIRSALAAPNAKVLLAGLLLAIAAGGAVNRVYPIYARDALGAGGDDLATATIAGALMLTALIPFSMWLAARMPRRSVALLGAVVWASAALAHLWLTKLWQSVVILALAHAFVNATIIALAALYLHILPRHGGLGQRLGLAIAPLLVAEMVARFTSALAYDLLVHDFGVIWVISAALALAAGIVTLGLRLPPWAQRADLAYGFRRLREILWGDRHGRRLFRGDIHPADADGVTLLESVQDALDPYVVRPSTLPKL
jgi:MFS family permease